jgi:hypothetical protein
MSQIPETTNASAPRQRSERVRGLGYNLYEVFRTSWTGGGASTSTGHRRVVRTVDRIPRNVSRVPPLPVIGFADGVQTQFLLRHEEHRPISLVWAAAGAVDHALKLLEFRQRLELVGSGADEALLAKLSELGGGLPFHVVAELTPWGVAASLQRVVDSWREELEGEVIASVPIPEDRHLVVDGSIRAHPRDGLVGVIKSVDTQYIEDESVIPDRAGWRSPVFSLPATTTAERDVVSCYLRLHNAPGSTTWSHGLIRLEARDPGVLDAACALAMRHRQGPGSGDGRWSVHLEGMHWAEQVLKAFRDPRLEI